MGSGGEKFKSTFASRNTLYDSSPHLLRWQQGVRPREYRQTATEIFADFQAKFDNRPQNLKRKRMKRYDKTVRIFGTDPKQRRTYFFSRALASQALLAAEELRSPRAR